MSGYSKELRDYADSIGFKLREEPKQKPRRKTKADKERIRRARIEATVRGTPAGSWDSRRRA